MNKEQLIKEIDIFIKENYELHKDMKKENKENMFSEENVQWLDIGMTFVRDKLKTLL